MLMILKGRRLGLGFCLGLLVLAPAVFSQSDKTNKSSVQKPSLTVTVTQAKTVSMPNRLVANGSIAAWQEASIGSEANGLRIEELRVNVGDHVRRGDVLAKFASETVKADVAQAQAGLAEAEASFDEATHNADRARGLQSSGAISKQQIAQYLTIEQTAKARVAAAKANLDVQHLRLKHTQVLAPDTGVISARSANLGAVIGNGGELFKMLRQGRLEWRAELSSSELSRVSQGMEANIVAPNGDVSKGKVRVVAPTVDAQTRSGLVYVDVLHTLLSANTKSATALKTALKPGMFAHGEFVLGHSNALAIPQSSVVVRDGFSYVFVLRADQHVTRQKVQTGRRALVGGLELLEIMSGLQEGVPIVDSGAGFLNEGDLVRVALAPVATSLAPAHR